jgi:hypothetical protein
MLKLIMGCGEISLINSCGINCRGNVKIGVAVTNPNGQSRSMPTEMLKKQSNRCRCHESKRSIKKYADNDKISIYILLCN